MILMDICPQTFVCRYLSFWPFYFSPNLIFERNHFSVTSDYTPSWMCERVASISVAVVQFFSTTAVKLGLLITHLNIDFISQNLYIVLKMTERIFKRTLFRPTRLQKYSLGKKNTPNIQKKIITINFKSDF